MPWGANCLGAEQTGKKGSGGWKWSGRTPDSECAQHIQLAQGQGRRWKHQEEPLSYGDEQEGYEGKQETRWGLWNKCKTGKKLWCFWQGRKIRVIQAARDRKDKSKLNGEGMWFSHETKLSIIVGEIQDENQNESRTEKHKDGGHINMAVVTTVGLI